MPYADPRLRAKVKRDSDQRRKNARRAKARSSRPFVNWDGEGYSAWVVDAEGICHGHRHFYILFGNSKPSYIYGPDLSTQRIFDFIFDEVAWNQKDNPINVSFAFDYDVNMILGDLSERHLRKLRQAGHCYWRGYRIEHRPHKWFQLSKRDQDARTSIRIYDGFAFFACGFVEACTQYLGNSDKLAFVASGKSRRTNFTYADLRGIIEYWTAENSLAVDLYNQLRLSINRAGLYISQWHGPGAIATALFQKHSIKSHISRDIPKDVSEAARFAYSSGRFEPFRGGFYAPDRDSDGVFRPAVWIADIHNAYPYAASSLPSLRFGSWEHLGARDAAREAKAVHRLAIYRIRLEGDGKDFTRSSLMAMPMPLFYRNEANRISYPVRVEGWYHQPEASAAAFLFQEKCQFEEAWIYSDNGDNPLRFLEDLYYERLTLKSQNDPAEKAVKLGANSAYGKIAQRVGWNEETRTPPPFHQLEWAGAITSRCREMVLAAMVASNRTNGLVSCDTDGIISTTPFKDSDLPNGIGPGLGQWEISEYSGILYIQNGVYWLRDLSGNWLPPKTRGIPRSQLGFETGFRAYSTGRNIVALQHQFIGYGTALRGRMESWRTWVDHPREFVFGGAGKRVHSPGLCLQCTPTYRPRGMEPGNTGLHNFVINQPGGGASYPHRLPWIEEIEDDPDSPFQEKRWEIIDTDL